MYCFVSVSSTLLVTDYLPLLLIICQSCDVVCFYDSLSICLILKNFWMRQWSVMYLLRMDISGLIPPPLTTVGKSTNIQWEGCMVQREERERMLDQKGCVIWITGLSGSGKSTLACALDHALLQRGKLSYVLDGDNVRHGLNNNLGFSAEGRAENIRRVGEVAKLFADTGVICIASFISPYRKDRDACREMMHSGDFIEVFMDVALEVCEQRDRKGLYKLARAGKIKGFTGIDDPYEDPPLPEIVMGAVDGVYASPEAMAAIILTYLGNNGFLKGP